MQAVPAIATPAIDAKIRRRDDIIRDSAKSGVYN
jgi:hypothetical protein